MNNNSCRFRLADGWLGRSALEQHTRSTASLVNHDLCEANPLDRIYQRYPNTDCVFCKARWLTIWITFIIPVSVTIDILILKFAHCIFMHGVRLFQRCVSLFTFCCLCSNKIIIQFVRSPYFWLHFLMFLYQCLGLAVISWENLESNVHCIVWVQSASWSKEKR